MNDTIPRSNSNGNEVKRKVMLGQNIELKLADTR